MRYFFQAENVSVLQQLVADIVATGSTPGHGPWGEGLIRLSVRLSRVVLSLLYLRLLYNLGFLVVGMKV